MAAAAPVNPYNPLPSWLDTGDNAWQLTSSTIVGMQSVPGLLLLYGGIVKKKWAVNSAFMVFYAFAAVLLCWVTWAYKMCFGYQWFFALGQAGPALGASYLFSQGDLVTLNVTVPFPMATLVYFQFVFAAITLILIAGALLGRMNFLAWMLFVPLWLTFSYTVGAFSVWGGGFLFQWGVIDWAGGYVIHVSSGFAGFTAAYWVGPRLQRDRERFPPNNTLLVLAGAGLLWLGWNGFNGGAPYAASNFASIAVLNTNICASMSVLVWTLLDYLYFGKPSVIGAVQGMITGLVVITPAAGFIHGWGALCMGFVAGSVPWFSLMIVGKRWSLLNTVDDTLGLLHTHGVAGFLGGTMTGLFCTPELAAAYALPAGTRGGFYGGWSQYGKQVAAALFIIVYNIIATSIICNLIRLVVPLRMSMETLELGDEAVHGEEAYATTGDGDADVTKGNWYGYDTSYHGGSMMLKRGNGNVETNGGAVVTNGGTDAEDLEMR